jgi:probable HAF family extracellular repeat protein
MKNKTRSGALSTAVFASSAMLTSLSALPQTQLPKYQVLDIGTLGGNQATAVDINDRGEVTGSASRADGWQHAFIYKDGKMVDLGTLQADRYGAGRSNGADINNKGEVAGQSLTLDGNSHAVLYSNGAATDLGTLGGLSSNGYALNESGQVSGISYLTGNGEYHAFLHSPGSGMRDLGTLGDSYSTGDGINDAGDVAGIYQLDFDTHAYLYTQGALVDLVPGISSYVSSTSVIINAAGHVTGTYRTDSTRSFLYRNGGIVDLGGLGGDFIFASALNDADQIVGDSTTASGSTHSFLWSEGAMADLGTLGGASSNAQAVNRSGQVTGQALTADGAYHPFVYTEGEMIDLGVPAGGTEGFGSAINAAGQVVGTYMLPDQSTFPPYVLRGFIATPISLLYSKLADKASKTAPGIFLQYSVRLAQRSYEASDLKGTCLMLTAFDVQAGLLAYDKRLAAQMKELIADARAIKAAVGCKDRGETAAPVETTVARIVALDADPAVEAAREWYRNRFGIDANGVLTAGPLKGLLAP